MLEHILNNLEKLNTHHAWEELYIDRNDGLEDDSKCMLKRMHLNECVIKDFMFSTLSLYIKKNNLDVVEGLADYFKNNRKEGYLFHLIFNIDNQKYRIYYRSYTSTVKKTKHISLELYNDKVNIFELVDKIWANDVQLFDMTEKLGHPNFETLKNKLIDFFVDHFKEQFIFQKNFIEKEEQERKSKHEKAINTLNTFFN
jgi:hypothetical protein